MLELNKIYTKGNDEYLIEERFIHFDTKEEMYRIKNTYRKDDFLSVRFLVYTENQFNNMIK